MAKSKTTTARTTRVRSARPAPGNQPAAPARRSVSDAAGDKVFAGSIDTVLAERIAGHARAHADVHVRAHESGNRTESGKFDAEPLAAQNEECCGRGRMPHPVVMVVMAAAAAIGLLFVFRRLTKR